MPRDMKTKMAQFDLQRLPECPFKIEVRSACKELPSEGTYELISTEKGEDGTVTMVLELVENEIWTMEMSKEAWARLRHRAAEVGDA